MNNKAKSNFSLRKLLLTALVAGPVGILPAPLWGLPSTAATNLTTSSGVTVTSGGTNALNIAAPDKAVLSWVEFGTANNPINSTDTLTYILPGATSSVLNLVTGGVASTINGSLVSNGNVYVLNSSGILFGSTANINTAGFYASAISDPLAATNFAAKGTIDFTGGTGNAVTVNGGTFQALGNGNNIYLAGSSVAVNAGTFYGNVTARTTGGAAQFTNGGQVSINTIAATNTGGNLTINTNGGDAILSTAGTTASILDSANMSVRVVQSGANYVAAPTVTLTGGGGSYTSATASIDGTGKLTGVTIVGAQNYTSVPTITLSGGGGSGAAVDLYVPTTGISLTSNGTSVAGITSPANPIGSGYTPNAQISLTVDKPTIYQSTNALGTSKYTTGYTTITTNGGLASIVANTNAAGQITSFTVTNPGYGYTSAPTVQIPAPTGQTMSIAGNLTIDTTGATVNGAVSQGAGNQITVAGTTTLKTNTTGGTLAAGDVNLSKVDLNKLILTSVGTTTIADQANGIILGAGTITPNATTALSITNPNSGSISMDGTAKMTIVPTATVLTPSVNLSSTYGNVTYSANGGLTIGTLTSTTSSGVATITASDSISVGSASFRTLSLTTTAGSITTGSIGRTDATITLSAPGNITTGSITAGNAVNVTSTGGSVTIGSSSSSSLAAGGSSNIKAVGDINIGGYVQAVSGINIASSAGAVTLGGSFSGSGTITAANNVTLATGAAATLSPTLSSDGFLTAVALGSSTGGGAGYTPNSSFTLTITKGTNSSEGSATGLAYSDSAGRISSFLVTGAGSGYLSSLTGASVSPTVAVAGPSNSVVANGALNINSTNGYITFGGAIVSSSTSELSLKAAGDITLPAVTAPVLTVTSTAGSISQTGAVVSTSKATLNSAVNTSLNSTSNDFNQVVVLGGAGANGTSITDQNDITLAGGTDAKGNLSLTSGALMNANPTIQISGATQAYVTFTNSSTGGALTGATIVNAGSGYTPNSTFNFNFVSPYANPTALNTVIGANTAGVNNFATSGLATSYAISNSGGTLSTAQNVFGPTIAGGKVTGYVVPVLWGWGYTPNSTVTVAVSGGGGSNAAAYAVTNADGRIQNVVITNPGTGYTSAPTFTVTQAGTAITQPTAYATTNASGAISSVVITDAGNGYVGGLTARGTLAAPSGGLATVATATGSNGAVTGYNLTNSGGNIYGVAPTITADKGAKVTATISNGTLSLAPVVGGGIALGSASTDSIKVAGNLTLATQASYAPVGNKNYGDISTVAQTIRVAGTVTASTNGGTAVIGTNPVIGSTTDLSFGQINASVGNGTLKVIENQTVNLGTINAGYVDVNSTASNITNSGAITISGTAASPAATLLSAGRVYKIKTVGTTDFTSIGAPDNNIGTVFVATGNGTGTGTADTVFGGTFYANSIFSPGDVTLTNVLNQMGGTLSFANAKNVTVYNTVATTVQAGAPNAIGQAVTGLTSVGTSLGKSITLQTTGGGDFTTVSLNAGGAVTVTDVNGLTLKNVTNTGANALSVSTSGPLVLDSGIALASTGAATFTSTGANASITDAGSISIYGAAKFVSDNGIALTKAGHSVGPVTLQTTGANGATSTSTDITYTEAATVNIAGITANTTNNVNAPAGNVTVTSTTGNIIQSGAITVSQVGTAAQAATFSASKGAVTLTSNNKIGVPVSITANNDSSLTQAANTILGNVAVAQGGLTVDASPLSGASISQAATTTAGVYGAASFKTAGGTIVLDASGNNFGPVSADTTANVATATVPTVGVSFNGGISGLTGAVGGSGYAPNTTSVTQLLNTNNVPAAQVRRTTNDAGVNSWVVTSGSGYTATPTVTIGSGSATATAKVDLTTGEVTGITVGGTNSGYTPGANPPSVTIAAPGGNGNITATASAIINADGSLTVNLGSNYSASTPPTLTALAAPANAAGAAVTVKEGNTLNLTTIKTGTGAFTATSEVGSIVATNPSITVGGITTLSAGSTGINLSAGTTFGGNNGIKITTTGNVSLQDSAANSVLLPGTNVGGSFSLRNINNGNIKDVAGAAGGSLTITGSVFLDAGNGDINISGPSNQFGAIQFRGNNVTLTEATSLNIAAGSLVNGAAVITSLSDIITSGAGTSIFAGSQVQGTQFISGGNITIANPIFVSNGLTFRATGTVDLSALSLSTNLNNRTPTNLGAGAYKAPQP